MHEKSGGTLAAAGLSFGVDMVKKAGVKNDMVWTQGRVDIKLKAKILGLVE